MKNYSASRVCENLTIANSTLRKYAALLENNGYKFSKNGHGRVYSEEDLVVLKLFIREKENNPKVKHTVIATRILDKRYGIRSGGISEKEFLDFPFHYFEEFEKRLMEIIQLSLKQQQLLKTSVEELRSNVGKVEKMIGDLLTQKEREQSVFKYKILNKFQKNQV